MGRPRQKVGQPSDIQEPGLSLQGSSRKKAHRLGSGKMMESFFIGCLSPAPHYMERGDSLRVKGHGVWGLEEVMGCSHFGGQEREHPRGMEAFWVLPTGHWTSVG